MKSVLAMASYWNKGREGRVSHGQSSHTIPDGAQSSGIGPLCRLRMSSKVSQHGLFRPPVWEAVHFILKMVKRFPNSCMLWIGI